MRGDDSPAKTPRYSTKEIQPATAREAFEIEQRKEIMQPRINIMSVNPGAMQAMLGLGNYLHKSGFDAKLLDLIYLRVSQINGCAYCIDMHWKDLRAAGETEQRLYGLDAWRESPYYTDRERAALAWAEAVTLVSQTHVPDEVFDQARRHFNDQELADLTLGVVAINGWNQLNIAYRTTPGAYQPAAKGKHGSAT
jgi:AhpD family alkylhydroperoxidase